MKIQLNYGRSGVSLTLPADAQADVIRKPLMPILANPKQAIADALDAASTRRLENQVGNSGFGLAVQAPSLERIAAGADSACIAICDITRPVPNHLFLRPLIERLIQSGITQQKITVLVATGLHRPNLDQELIELIADPWVLENVNVENHYARRDQDHVDLGVTSTRGTVVKLDRRFVEADVRIATGLVEPHFMAGYSGGRKVIAPGLAHAETITTLHSARFMADPAARNCNFDGNPLHEEQLEIVRMLGEVYALNTVIDEQRQLSFVNFGDILTSHADAVNFVRRFCEVEVPRKYKTVVTSAAGYPLDKTYYQTIKGMVGAMGILAPGGDLIIASECSEGMGSEGFLAAQHQLVESGPDAFLSSILQKSHADIDEWQTQMQLKPMAIGRIELFSDQLSSADQRLTGVHRAESLQQSVRESIARHDCNRVAVIPEGPYVVPFCRPQHAGEIVA